MACLGGTLAKLAFGRVVPYRAAGLGDAAQVEGLAVPEAFVGQAVLLDVRQAVLLGVRRVGLLRSAACGCSSRSRART